MNFKSGNTIISLIALTISLVVSLLFFTKKTESATGFINIQTVYDQFDMKKELEAEYLNVESKRKMVIDSLKLVSNTYYQQNFKGDDTPASVKRELQIRQKQIEMKEKQFSEDNAVLTQKYTDQILKQINQYVYDYGKENKYKYIFGANSSGTLMYARDSEDITDLVLEYINQRYSGK